MITFWKLDYRALRWMAVVVSAGCVVATAGPKLW